MKHRIFKQIISLVLILSLAIAYIPSALAEELNKVKEFTPLQDRLNGIYDEDEIIEMPAEPISIETEEPEPYTIDDETQALMDEINNNTFYAPEHVDLASEVEAIDEESGLLGGVTSTLADEFIVEPTPSVYNVVNNNNDYVSLVTGALTYKKNIFTLPGANGLDLDLSIVYNSANAIINQNLFSDTNEKVRADNFNSFSPGWSFGFPSIIKSNVRERYGWKKETHLSFPDGSGYKIFNNNTSTNTESETDTVLTLAGYKLTDMTLVKKYDTGNYELTYSNGTVYVFDGVYGNLQKITNIHGDKITFKYTEYEYHQGSFWDYIFNPSYYFAKVNMLTEIIDTGGRCIKIVPDISETAISDGCNLEKIKVYLNDVLYAQLNFERRELGEGNFEILTEYVDGEGFKTKYTYDEKACHIYDATVPKNTNSYWINNGTFVALTQVQHPTGGCVYYEYEKARRSLNKPVDQGWYEAYKIICISDTSGFCKYFE